MGKAEVSLDHLYRVFTKPEHSDSTLTRIERHLSDNISDFLSQHVVAKNTSLEEIEADFNSSSIPDSPEFVSDHAQRLLNTLVAQSVNTYAPTFIGHMTSALPYFHLTLAKLLVGLNQNLVKIETSKAFTPLERQVLGMMHNLVYNNDQRFYNEHLHSAEHALGAFCSGGTIANITALWVARNKLLAPSASFKGVHKAGLVDALRHYNINNLGIISSKRAHYSLAKAVDVLGIGRDHIITVKSAEQTLDPERVLARGREYQEQGNKLLAIVGVAGTTETGHVDPLDELADVAKELGCWFHVDAAWGGATLFSNKYKGVLSGIERADSVTIDAHKQMYVPMGAGMTLFKDPSASNHVRHHAQYILRQGSKDLGSTTLEGSRNGMALMVYASLHIFGRRGYELLIDKSIEFARTFSAMIEQHPDFEVITQPVLSILTYRLRPAALTQLVDIDAELSNDINEKLDNVMVLVQKQQREAGKSFVSRTRIDAEQYKGAQITVFRVVLANPLTEESHLQSILSEQLQLALDLPDWISLANIRY